MPEEENESAPKERSESRKSSEIIPRVPNTAIHASMYAIAERYGLKGLRNMAAKNFLLAFREYSDDCCLRDTREELFAVIYVVYGTTVESDKELRNEVIDFVNFHLSTLLEFEDF